MFKLDTNWNVAHHMGRLASMSGHWEHRLQRRLVYIPIVHTLADMGALGRSVQKEKAALIGRKGVARNAAVVEKLWNEIERVVRGLELVPGNTWVYQDGLPVCEHEREIVASLAEAGSRNHKLLLELQARGATLVGTESPDLLIEEYQLAVSTFSPVKVPRAHSLQRSRGATLLERRDRFIAERIGQTLGGGGMGILFIGAQHAPTKYLAHDIEVIQADLASWRGR